MTTTQYKSLLASIANIISDYRQSEIPQIDPDHIERWVYQFDKDDRSITLSEMEHLLRSYYISHEQAQNHIRLLLKSTNIFGTEPAAVLPYVQFLDIQRKGSSQADLLMIVRQYLQSDYRIDLGSCGKDPKIYIYLDDCLFSGNTAFHDIEDWIPKAVAGSTLFYIFFASYSEGLDYLKRRINPIANKYNIIVKFGRIRTLENSPSMSGDIECFWPRRVADEPLIDSYLASLSERCQDKTFAPRTFRPARMPHNERVFSSPEARVIIERAFLRAGAHIVSLSANSKWQMRPMGYEYLESLGFGALVITYRNISNNCPLALWWGDPDAPATHPFSKWFPLFHRKANTVASWTDE